MGKKFEYRREAKETSDESTNVDIELPAVPNGYKRTIQNLSAEDETSDFTELRVGYKTRFDVYHWWIEEEALVAARLYWMDKEKRLLAGDKLVVRFTGTSNEDVIAAYVDGFDERVEVE